MAYSLNDQVRVADQSSEYRGHSGVVKGVSGDNHDVRLFGHSCAGRVVLRTDQLQADTRAVPIDYSRC